MRWVAIRSAATNNTQPEAHRVPPWCHVYHDSGTAVFSLKYRVLHPCCVLDPRYTCKFSVECNRIFWEVGILRTPGNYWLRRYSCCQYLLSTYLEAFMKQQHPTRHWPSMEKLELEGGLEVLEADLAETENSVYHLVRSNAELSQVCNKQPVLCKYT